MVGFDLSVFVCMFGALVAYLHVVFGDAAVGVFVACSGGFFGFFSPLFGSYVSPFEGCRFVVVYGFLAPFIGVCGGIEALSRLGVGGVLCERVVWCLGRKGTPAIPWCW